MSDSENQWVCDATDEDFDEKVLEKSKSTLCIVDFWAAWCGPCKVLGPVLDELAQEFEGKFTLVKVNTEQAQQKSMEYGIQSIPMVFAFSNGEVIDGFSGAMPKPQIQEWIESLFSKNELSVALGLVDSDPQAAADGLKKILEAEPENAEVLTALGNAYLALDQVDDAKSILQKLEDRGFLESEGEKLKAKLEMKSKSGVDLEGIRSQSESNPDDLELRLELADALVGNGEYVDAFEICLDLVRRDKVGFGDKARQLMVDVFKSLPDDSDLTHEYRRKLTMLLY